MSADENLRPPLPFRGAIRSADIVLVSRRGDEQRRTSNPYNCPRLEQIKGEENRNLLLKCRLNGGALNLLRSQAMNGAQRHRTDKGSQANKTNGKVQTKERNPRLQLGVGAV